MSNKRIAICAQSFGFGPVSKATSIAKGLLKNPEVEMIYIGNSVSKEFFKREGLWNEKRDITIDSDDINKVDFERFGGLDAAIVVIDPKLARYFYKYIPVYFVDSLGFMWDKGFFQTYPFLKNLEAYFVQDVFGACDLLRSKGVQNIVPVGAIIDTTQSKQSNLRPEYTFHLGGLINIFAKRPIEKYINGVSKIINEIGTEKQSLVLTSQKAIGHFNVLKNNAIPVMDITHNETLKIFAQSEIVFTSPGLTTLLELAYLQVPIIPLPPQNLSQALIINSIVKQWNEPPKIWNYLAAYYPITHEMNEDEGVRQVQKLNSKLLYDNQFIYDYIKLTKGCYDNKDHLKLEIFNDFSGVENITKKI